MKHLLLVLALLVFSLGCEHEILRTDEKINVTIVVEDHPEATYTVQHYSFFDYTTMGFMWNWKDGGDLEMEYDTSEIKIVLQGRVTFGTLKVDPAVTIYDTLVTTHDTTFVFKIY